MVPDNTLTYFLYPTTYIKIFQNYYTNIISINEITKGSLNLFAVQFVEEIDLTEYYAQMSLRTTHFCVIILPTSYVVSFIDSIWFLALIFFVFCSFIYNFPFWIYKKTFRIQMSKLYEKGSSEKSHFHQCFLSLCFRSPNSSRQSFHSFLAIFAASFCFSKIGKEYFSLYFPFPFTPKASFCAYCSAHHLSSCNAPNQCIETALPSPWLRSIPSHGHAIICSTSFCSWHLDCFQQSTLQKEATISKLDHDCSCICGGVSSRQLFRKEII